MRHNIKAFVAFAARTLPIKGPIFEFGALQVETQEGFADLRPYFPGMEYVGCDMRPGLGVDRILNLHDLDLPDNSAGTVLSLETLEHVEYPHRAVSEIFRVLAPGGVAILSSVMCFPIHEYPHDYWRFTPEAFRSLLRPFGSSFVGFGGDADFPHTIVGVAVKAESHDFSSFEKQYLEWQRNQADPFTIKEFAKSLTPPLLLPLVTSVYRSVREAFRPSKRSTQTP